MPSEPIEGGCFRLRQGIHACRQWRAVREVVEWGTDMPER